MNSFDNQNILNLIFAGLSLYKSKNIFDIIINKTLAIALLKQLAMIISSTQWEKEKLL
jgi:hypothetical protein